MAKRIIGIDPGSEETGYCIIDEEYNILAADKVENNSFLHLLDRYIFDNGEEVDLHIAIESIQSYGMQMGKTTIETCYMIGMIIQAVKFTWDTEYASPFFLYPRPQYGKAICGSNKVNDALIRTALENRFGSYDKGKAEKRLKNGTIKQKFEPEGPLFKISGATDKRSAFAVAAYHLDLLNNNEVENV